MSKKTKESPHVRQSGFRNARNSFTFGIQNYAQEIWNPVLKTGIPDPRSTAKESEIQFLDSRIHSVESRIQDLHGAKRRNQYRGCSMSNM